MNDPFPALIRSEKLGPAHYQRLAVVYVRQSTPQQVIAHHESTRIQYGLTTRAEALGWSAERILVIDDDLGKSGASAVQRQGFQRLVSEVSLGHVGLILGVEMSRLARSNTDWHRLLEVCALFGTCIADLDGVYDPTQYNDRLLLGLKGTMSEAELHLLKQRLYQGSLSKARRGALHFALPIGYVWDAEGTIQFDPDEQVQQVVRLIFAQFEALGTLGSVLRYLAQHAIQVGIRVREGPGKGTLIWRRPNRMTLQNMLKHPLYAGAYVYGRRQDDPRRKHPEQLRSGRVVVPPAHWHTFLPDRCPAYITWEQYERNQARLATNRARAESMGAPREGPALLAGVIRCARCQARLIVHYHGQPARHSYECSRIRGNYGGPSCQHLPGACLDAFVSEQVLLALEPAALELSLAATEQVEQERARMDHLWQQRRERATYEAERAARAYHAVEPENRLVARTLEHTWETKLMAQQQVEEEYHRYQRQQPHVLTEQERMAIRQLATDIPALWQASTTTDAERKEIIRQVVEQVEVDAQGTSEVVRVRITWVGGSQTEGQVIRPIAKLADLQHYPHICQRVQDLSTAGWTSQAIAQALREEGLVPPHAGTQFSAQTVIALQRRLGLTSQRTRRGSQDLLAPHEWWSTQIAQELSLAKSTLYAWIQRGWVRARQEEQAPHRWIIWADAEECERLRLLHERSLSDEARQRWTSPERS